MKRSELCYIYLMYGRELKLISNLLKVQIKISVYLVHISKWLVLWQGCRFLTRSVSSKVRLTNHSSRVCEARCLSNIKGKFRGNAQHSKCCFKITAKKRTPRGGINQSGISIANRIRDSWYQQTSSSAEGNKKRAHWKLEQAKEKSSSLNG